MGNVNVAAETNLIDENQIPQNFGTHTNQTALHRAAVRHNKTLGVFLTDICNKYPSRVPSLLQPLDDLGCNAFHYAVCKGDVEVANDLMMLYVESGIFNSPKDLINHRIKNGPTSLHIAIYYCHYDMLHFLVMLGGDVTVATDNGATPLHCAAIYGDTKTLAGSLPMVELLLKSGAKVNTVNAAKQSPLLYALGVDINRKSTLQSQSKIALLLLDQQGINFGETMKGLSTLHLACSRGYRAVASILIQNKVPVNEPTGEGKYCIHYAAEKNFVKIVKLLLDNNADPNVKTKKHLTPLMMAATNGNLEIIELLVSSKADVNVANDYGTCLINACKSGNVPAVQYLVDHDADISLSDKNGYTAIHHSCKREFHEICELLLQKHNNVNTKANNGFSPLFLACHSSADVKTIEVLLKYEADVNATNKDNDTALHAAARNSDYNAMELLLKHGVDVSCVDKDSKSALALCVENEDVEGVKLIISNGVPTPTYSDGLYQLAIANGSLEIAEILKSIQ